jgi:hypothetical protein
MQSLPSVLPEPSCVTCIKRVLSVCVEVVDDNDHNVSGYQLDSAERFC